MSKISHRSMMTAIPMATTVRIPFTLDAHVRAINVPQARIQSHQSKEKSLRRVDISGRESHGRESIPVSEFLPPDVRIHCQGHEENQSSVEKDKTILGYMSIV